MSRLEYLAVVAYDLLVRQRNSDYVLDLATEEINYDGVECSGDCLIDDLANELLPIFKDIKPDTEIDIDSLLEYKDGKYQIKE